MNSKSLAVIAVCVAAALLVSAVVFNVDNNPSGEGTEVYDGENGAFYKWMPLDVMILGIGDIADQLGGYMPTDNYKVAYSDDYELSLGYDLVFLTQDWVNDNFDTNLVSVNEMLDSGSVVSAYYCNPGWYSYGPNVEVSSVDSACRSGTDVTRNSESDPDREANVISTITWAMDEKILTDKVLDVGILGTGDGANALKGLLQSDRTTVAVGDADDLSGCDMIFITQSWIDANGSNVQSIVKGLVESGYIVSSYECDPGWVTMGITVSYSSTAVFDAVYHSGTVSHCYGIECDSAEEAADNVVAWAFFVLYC
jgi:hypothetical protein